MIIPLLLASLMGYAQQDTIYNFLKQSNALIWQKVYHFPKDDANIVDNFFFQNSEFTYDRNIGIAYPCLKDFSDAKFGERPVFFNDEARIKFIVQLKDDRYRVTIQSFEPVDTFIRGYLNKDRKDRKYLDNFLEYYIKGNGSIRTSFFKIAQMFDEALSLYFDYTTNTAASTLDDDF